LTSEERDRMRLALLALGRQLGANARVGIQSTVAAEAAGDFLLRLESAQVVLCLVVHDA
jgi:hypothetical protein